MAAYTVTYSATDAAGNTGTATRTVNVVDTVSPTLDVSGLSATVESGATALGSVSANESVTWSVAGNAAFAASADLGSEAEPTSSIALGDVNGDGHLDVLARNDFPPSHLYLSDGSGGYAAPVDVAIGCASDGTFGDVNGDGHLDLVAGALYLGDGSGALGPLQKRSLL